MTENITGRVHSIQSMGTVDGPGIRFVVFAQGCPLRCKCCHNPDTWDMAGGKQYTAEELVARAVRCREYFGKEGGVTVSGGEPLLQAEFVREMFERCHKQGINTCLDTSGCILTDSVRAALEVTDQLYRENVGCGIQMPLDFLEYLKLKNIPTTLRQVVIPTVNDNEENIAALREIARRCPNVDKVELLPFRKICQVKYDKMGIEFPFAHIDTPSKSQMAELEGMLRG